MPITSRDRKIVCEKWALEKRLINEYRGLANFILAKVKHFGRGKILAKQRNDEDYWLKETYNRLLNFTEECYLKRIPQEIAGDPNRPIKIIIQIPNPATEPEYLDDRTNRIKNLLPDSAAN